MATTRFFWKGGEVGWTFLLDAEPLSFSTELLSTASMEDLAARLSCFFVSH